MMELAPIREDLIYRRQSRKKQAQSMLKISDVAAADFETIDGYAWLYTMSWFDKKGEQHSALVEYDVDHRFTIGNFVDDVYARCGDAWRGSGKRKGLKLPYFFYWNLGFDAGCILKHLKDRVIDAILDDGEIVINADTHELVEVEWEKGRIKLSSDQYSMRLASIKYLHRKYLYINPLGALKSVHCKKGYRRNRGPLHLFDIAQFYRMSLNGASKKYLNAQKLDVDAALAGQGNEAGFKYRCENRQKLMEYALIDSELTAKLAWMKVEEFQSQGVRMIMPYSGASVSQRNMLDTCQIPTLNEIWKKNQFIVKAAWTAYTGGWFETVSVGVHGDVRCFDLTSAYPYIMYHLADCSLGEGLWIDGTWKNKIQCERWLETRRPYSAGFIEARVEFPKGLPIYPAAKMSKKGCVINPRICVGWFTGDEIIEFRKWGAKINIERWVIHIETKSRKYPLRPFIEKWYEMKYKQGQLKGTDEFDAAAYTVAKECINSGYGKLLQTNEQIVKSEFDMDNYDMSHGLLEEVLGEMEISKSYTTGKLFNPIWGAIITAGTRVRLAELIRVNGVENLIQVATDGIIMKNKENIILPPNPLPAIRDLGEWTEETYEDGREGKVDALIMMSGVYSLIDENWNVKSKYRGGAALFLGKEGQPKDWVSFCQDNFELGQLVRDEHNHPHSRPYTLGEARIKGDYSLVNIFRPVKCSVSACGDSNKRRWVNKPIKFGDLLLNDWPSKPHEQMEVR